MNRNRKKGVTMFKPDKHERVVLSVLALAVIAGITLAIWTITQLAG